MSESQLKPLQYGKCECCQRDLDEYEKDLCDCGHYACNSCAYSKDGKYRLETYCEKCMGAGEE